MSPVPTGVGGGPNFVFFFLFQGYGMVVSSCLREAGHRCDAHACGVHVDAVYAHEFLLFFGAGHWCNPYIRGAHVDAMYVDCFFDVFALFLFLFF